VRPDNEARHASRWFWAWLLLPLAPVLARSAWEESRHVDIVAYSVFEAALRDGRISDVQVGDRLITGTLRVPGPMAFDVSQ